VEIVIHFVCCVSRHRCYPGHGPIDSRVVERKSHFGL